MRQFRTWVIGTTLALCVITGPARADRQIHQQVRDSLVELTVTGTARVGPATGTAVTGSGTGFFVGTDGYILTTAHLFEPLKSANAANTVIEAEFKGTGTGSVEALYVSELASLDLVLLRAIIPNEIEVPPSLVLGDTKDVDLSDPQLLTSGFDLTGYRQRTLEFNSTSNSLANFAWTINGKTNSGASGSPVYIDKNGQPHVVGILKATARDDDELTLMIPIEYSFQLVGHFKMQELITELEQLKLMIGETAEVKPPLNNRVEDIEKSVDQIESSFTWQAEADERTGALVITYQKLVSEGPQIDEISVKIQPTPFVRDDSDPTVIRAQPTLTWPAINQPRTALDPSGRTGIFVLPGIQSKLTDEIDASPDTIKGQEPFRDIILKISAKIGDTSFQTKVSMVPKFAWVYGDN